MNPRLPAYQYIAACLRAGLLEEGTPPPKPDDLSWELIVKAAGRQFVTPSLGWCLRDQPLPETLRDYFDAMLQLNGEHNERMLASLERSARVLNPAGVEPLALKGAASLLDAIYPQPNLRIMADVDFLIPERRAQDVVALLCANGWVQDAKGVAFEHHLAPLVDTIAAVRTEVHVRMSWNRHDSVLPPDIVLKSAERRSLGAGTVLLATAGNRIAHNVVHSQIMHDWHRLGALGLRSLLDLALVRKRYEAAIDWKDLIERFKSAGLQHVLQHRLCLCQHYFGQPVPAAAGAFSAEAVQRVERGLTHPILANTRAASQSAREFLSTLHNNPRTALTALTRVARTPVQSMRKVFRSSD